MVAVATPPPYVMVYDEEFCRLFLLTDEVPVVGQVVGGYTVARVRESNQTFTGRPIVYVYVRR